MRWSAVGADCREAPAACIEMKSRSLSAPLAIITGTSLGAIAAWSRCGESRAREIASSTRGLAKRVSRGIKRGTV